MLRKLTQVGWGVSDKRYEGVRFNVISVTRGWVGVPFPEKRRYVTLDLNGLLLLSPGVVYLATDFLGCQIFWGKALRRCKVECY